MDRRRQILTTSLPAALGVAALLWILGCEGSVSRCPDGDCPTVPGCEGDVSVTCGPDHVCLERVCEGMGWICGKDSSGVYKWLRKAAPCDDKDPCTDNDLCAVGRCYGTPRTCDQPPTSACADGVTLKTYDSKGTCQNGLCVYSNSTVKCPSTCKAGQCEGSPCTGIKCDNPPGECYKKPGKCVAGKCIYDPEPSGTACGIKDKCYATATCDGKGGCTGKKLDCSRSNTTGGTCVAGVCQGYKCNSGYGNCNNTWNDGCEMALTSTAHCGKCGNACGSVAHGKPACTGGKCVVGSCSSPYKDCDGSYGNGCEIPVGVANGCSKSGLTYNPSGHPSGCGTPWCGKSSKSGAVNFGSWACVFCTKCHYFPDGWSWCLFSGSNTGKFSSARCSSCCNSSYKDLVCK